MIPRVRIGHDHGPVGEAVPLTPRVKGLLVDAAKQLAELLAMDNDAGHVSDDLHSVARRWRSAGLPGARVFAYERVVPSPGVGIAAAWAAHRAKSKRKRKWALEDGEGYSNWAHVDDALADRITDGHTTATLIPCEQAWPSGKDLYHDAMKILDRINECPEDVVEWSDYAYQESDVVEIVNARNTRCPQDDLAAMVAVTFRRWAEKWGKDVTVNAWRFTGPPRQFRYEHAGPRLPARAAPGQWIEVVT